MLVLQHFVTLAGFGFYTGDYYLYNESFVKARGLCFP